MIKFYEIELLKFTYLKSEESNQITINSFREDLFKILNKEDNMSKDIYEYKSMDIFEFS